MEIIGQTLTFTPQDVSQSRKHIRPRDGRRGCARSIWRSGPRNIRSRGRSTTRRPKARLLQLPEGYSDVSAHEANFFNAVRTRKPTVENEEFGNHAAIGCHLANYAYFKNRIATWDANAKTIRG